MPELPEVEAYRKYFEEACLGATIKSVEANDLKILKTTPDELKQAVIGHSIKATQRIGKYLFLISTSGTILVVHFGLTGDLEYFREEADRPRFARVIFHFEDGYKMAYNSMRKFGWIDLTNDIDAFAKSRKLAPDGLDIGFDQFSQSMKRSKAPIKVKLLDQQVVAGVGNWIADDILYQSAIHPETPTNSLKAEQVRLIFDKMKHVLEIAVQHEADASQYPEYFLIHNRTKDGVCFHTGDAIERIVVGGRGTFISPKRQALDI
ncbi:MAG: DNA-formamidopyrimidine glycosylase family protein [Bacteroidota bacterium]